MKKLMLRAIIVLGALSPLVLTASTAQWLRLVTAVSEGTLGEAAGDYSLDGEAHGYPKYKQDGKGPRYLYRSPNGAWSITSSSDNIAKSKGTVVSIEAAGEPFGLRYKYYDKISKKWRDDDALSVVDISLEVQSDLRAQEALARRQAEDQRRELAAEALAAEDARKAAEKRARNLAALKAGWVHPEHEARRAAAAKMDALVAQALLAEEVAVSAQAQADQAALQAESVLNETVMNGGVAAAAAVGLNASAQPQATSTSTGAAAAGGEWLDAAAVGNAPLPEGQSGADAANTKNESLITAAAAAAAAAATKEREEERAAWAAAEAARASAEAEAFAAAFTAAYDAFEAPDDETQDVLVAADSLLSEDVAEGQKKLLLATDSRPYVRLKEAIAARMVKEAAAGKAAASALQLEVASLQAAAENAKAVHADAAAAARQALEGGASSADVDAQKAALEREAAAQAEATRAAALAEEASQQLKEQAAAAEEARAVEEASAKQRQVEAEAALAEARAQVAADAEALAVERAKMSEEVAILRQNAKIAEEKAEAERAERAAQAARDAERAREQQLALKEEASRASNDLIKSQEAATATAASAVPQEMARKEVEATASPPAGARAHTTAAASHQVRSDDLASPRGDRSMETVSEALVVLLLEEEGGLAAVTAALTRGEPGATALATGAAAAVFLVVILFFTCALCALRGGGGSSNSSSSNAAAMEAAARMEAAAAQARADAAQQLELEKQRLEMARLQGEQRAGEAEQAAKLAEKQRLDSEAREARRLKAMEEMVERLQFENQRAADIFHDQAGEMEELRKSLLDVQTELSDVRRSQSSLNVLAGSSSVNVGGGAGSVNARLAGLRQSNQDILRSSRLSLTQSLRNSRESFSGLPSSSMAAATMDKDNGALAHHQHASSSVVESFGEFAGPAADKAALPFGSPIASASMPRFGGVNASMSPVQAAAVGVGDTSNEGVGRNGRSFSGDDENRGGGGGGDDISQGSQEYDDDDDVDDDDESMDDEVRQVLEDAIVANYRDAEKAIEFGAGSIGMSFEDFSSVTQDPSVRPCDAVVVVTRVFEGSAAEQSGVQAGDLIVALNGDRIPSEYTKDDILEVLVGAARPLTISFKERL